MKNCPGSALRAAACAALIVVTAAGAADPKAAQFYEDALLRYEKRDAAGAIIQLKNALRHDPKMLSVHVLLGKALLDDGQVSAAEAAFDEALRLGVDRAEVVIALAGAVLGQAKPQDVLSQPRFADAGLPAGVRVQLLVAKAGAASDLGQHRDAIRFIDDAKALDPKRAETLVADVPVRVRAGRLPEALAAAEQALKLAPTMAEALYQRGTVAHLQGDLKGALGYYDRAIAARPAHADSRVSRAGLLMDLQRFDDAAPDVAAVRKSSAIDPRGAYLAALLAERAGDKAAARKALNDVTALLDPVPIEFLRYRVQLLMLGGLAHHGLNQYEKALPYLEAAQRQQPASGVSKLLAQVYLRQRNHDRAVEVLDAYLKTNPRDAQAVQLLASAHLAQGRHARAAAVTQEALKKVDDPGLHGALGMSLVGSGKFALAATELETAFKRDPGQFQAGAALASLYLQSGQRQRALTTADTLVKHHPGNPGALNLQGLARAARGDAAGARSAFEAALKAAPDYAAPQVNIARLDIAANNHDAATARLTGVLAKDEKQLDALLELARIAQLRQRPDDAQRWLEKAVGHSGPKLQPGLALADFHLAHKRPDRAAEAVRALQSKAPDALAVLLTQARVQLAQRDVTGAKATLTRATAGAAYDAAALVQIALLQLQAGNIGGAHFALDKALSEKPGHLNARALMAEVELRQGEVAKAEARARALVASHPELGVGHALLGDVAAARGQRTAAIDAYRKAHALDTSDASMLRLFDALAQVDPAAAARGADDWLAKRPQALALRRAAANAHARSGNLSAARKGYEALLQLAPDDADALNNLANVQVLLGDAKAALASAERALALQPDAAHVIGTAGWAAFHAGQADRALQMLRDARLRDPANADTRYFLGAVLAQRGRASEAREELQGALHGTTVTSYAKDAERLLATLK